MTDAPRHLDPLFWAARQRGNRDRSMPVVGARDPIGHLPDPRITPPGCVMTLPGRVVRLAVIVLILGVCIAGLVIR